MADKTIGIPIIRTKLHRPPLASEHVHRLHLLERLDRNLHNPLTLLSAPAGYGKSTLLSCWLEASDIESAWLSLNESDSDLRVFLSYFVAAVQTIFPKACHRSETMINAPGLPPLSELTQNLINELDQLEKKIILVLDDYQFIREKAVNDLLTELIKYCPKPMHFVLSTRRDQQKP